MRLLQLAVVSREHALLLGPTGTAKSELISALARHVEARHFSYLLTRFTEPSEIFGTLDFERFRQGTYHVRTEGMLPTADIVFLDEVFQGSSAILNTLLTLLNERRYHNGARPENVPLISMLGATNELPDDPGLTAFSDRFLIRLQVEPVGAPTWRGCSRWAGGTRAAGSPPRCRRPSRRVARVRPSGPARTAPRAR